MAVFRFGMVQQIDRKAAIVMEQQRWDDEIASDFLRPTMRTRHFFRRLFRLPAWKLRLLAEASFWLIVARLALLVMPFPRIGRYLGTLQSPSIDTAQPDSEQAIQVIRIGRAVDAAAEHSPLPLVCLPRALAGWQMLHRRGIASRLHFGALPKSAEAAPGLLTHAWLSSDGIEVTGYPVAYGCVELGYYARELYSSPAKSGVPAPTQ
jgi:hypothetical protein